MRTMRAIRLHETGGPEVLRVEEVPVATPGPGQVLVKAAFIGVGTADQLVRTGRYDWQPQLPAIPGLEMSGWITEIGPDVTGFKVGDPVVVYAAVSRECYAEYTVQDAKWVLPLPDGIDMALAGCLFNYRTAYRILTSGCRLREGDNIAVVGAAGGVGGALVELAGVLGARPIGVVRGPTKTQFVRDGGCADVIDTRSTDLGDEIGAMTGGRGVDHLLDPVAGPEFKDLLRHLGPAGTLTLYGIINDWPNEQLFSELRNRTGLALGVRFFSMHAFDHDPEGAREDYAFLSDLLLNGKIKPRLHERLPLERIQDAHQWLEDGSVLGKIILDPTLGRQSAANRTR